MEDIWTEIMSFRGLNRIKITLCLCGGSVLLTCHHTIMSETTLSDNHPTRANKNLHYLITGIVPNIKNHMFIKVQL